MSISFIDYDRITDTILFFNRTVTLNFCVNLNKKAANGTVSSFHSEVGFYNEYLGKKGMNIKRYIDSYFLINDNSNFKNNIVIRSKDIVMLRLLLNDMVLPWFIGSKRIYKTDNIGKMILKGKFNVAEFPLSEYKFISFYPIIIDYEDGTSKEGVRMCINSNDNYIDLVIDKFLEFYYFINNTDMYNAAISLLNYVKSEPYGTNYFEYNPDGGNNKSDNNWNNNVGEHKTNGGKGKSFFDK